jgi:L-amino acid N-acyltransferase YncA
VDVIREACCEDLPAILDIYNQVIATTTAVYSEAPVTLQDREEWWRTRVARGFPVLVAATAEGVLGFSSFGDFRPWPCYRTTVEHSVHVRDGHRGRGLGPRLVQPLFARAAALDKHLMIAAIDAQNAASLALHTRLGFEQAGHFHEVGYKFGRWLDLVFMQRRIGAADRAP